MENFELFKISHSTYIKEKYLSMLKELEHLQNISAYYDLLTDPDYENFKDLKENIIKFRGYIEQIYKHEFYSLDYLEACEYMHDFVIRLDIQNMKIEKFLRYFSSLHKKLLQLVAEVLPHHLPTPSTGKRYSSKILSDYLHENTNKLYKFLLTEDEVSEIHLYWEHIDSYKLDGYNSQMFLEQNPMRFVSHSFYYHDIVWNIPTLIDREVILHAMKSKKFSEIKQNFIKDIGIALANLSKEAKGEIEKIPKTKNSDDFIQSFEGAFTRETFIVELMGDIVGLIIHGEAYVLSFLHETLGRSYGRDFYHDSDTVLEYIEYNCNPIRDTQIVRQRTLLNFYLVASQKNNPDFKHNPYLQEIVDVLDYMSIGKVKEGREDIFNPNKEPNSMSQKKEDSTRKVYRIIMANIIGIVGNALKCYYPEIENKIYPSTPIHEYKDDIFIRNEGEELRYINSELWDERFSSIINSKRNEYKIPHKSILRKKILEISFSDDYEMTPYILKFNKSIENGDGSCISFGLFDDIKITPSKENFNIEDEINSLFDIIEDPLPVIHKHSLLKMKEVGSSQNNYSSYKLYVLITLKNTFDFESMKNIETWCDNAQRHIIYYKSLGPQDIVLEFFCNNSADVWGTLNTFRKDNQDYIAKTYSIVSACDDGNNDKLDIHALCGLSMVKDVEGIKNRLFENKVFSDNGWNNEEWKKKIVLHNTIGRKAYELNFYSISLGELKTIEGVLRRNGDMKNIEYFFNKKC
ncbi:MAG TPA: hypothetical protein EYG81_00625 [Archaeoglobus profundus]|nr:hypothetical protein [Archaeoglobus profundus]